MRIEAEPSKLPTKDFFYFELKDGKVKVSEEIFFLIDRWHSAG